MRTCGLLFFVVKNKTNMERITIQSKYMAMDSSFNKLVGYLWTIPTKCIFEIIRDYIQKECKIMLILVFYFTNFFCSTWEFVKKNNSLMYSENLETCTMRSL